ncbi:hypothetical protein AKJ16_DCAP25177 [Drosera capensis]
MESFLLSYGFIGFVDGSIVSPPMHLLYASSAPVLNPDYFQSMKLKRKLTSLRKASSDSMEKYLCDIKILADSMAAINSPVSNTDLIEHTLMGLGTEFESLITVLMNAPIAPSFDEIRSKLLLHEQRLKFLSSTDVPQHQAFAVAPRSSRGRGKLKGDRWDGRPSQSTSGHGSYPGYISTGRTLLQAPSKGCVYPFSIATSSPPLVSHKPSSVALAVFVVLGSTWHGMADSVTVDHPLFVDLGIIGVDSSNEAKIRILLQFLKF